MTQSSDKPLEQGAIPEVEAEVVETASVEAPEAAPFDDAPDAEEKPVKPRAPLRSPGVILFGVFALIALGIFAWWRFAPREGAVEPVEASAPAPVVEQAPPPAEIAPDAKISNAPLDDLKRVEPSEPAPDAGYLPPVVDQGKIGNTVEDSAKEALRRFREAEEAQAAEAQIPPTDDTPSFDIAPTENTPENTSGESAPVEEAALAAPETEITVAPLEAASTDPAPVELAPMETASADAPVAAPVVDEKIANELADLKRTYAAETQQLAAALEAEQRVSAERASEIEALKAALAERDAAANEEIAGLRAELEKIRNEEAAAPSQAMRASLALTALKRALDQGAPYRVELDALTQFAPDAEGALGAYADKGVVSEQALRQRFDSAARAAMSAAAQEKAGNGVARLLARAANVISVRPAVPTAGDTPGAVLSRAEHALNEGETEFALLQLEDLPVSAQEAMADWIADARARAEMESAAALLEKRLHGDMD